jgi:hypothetical protein
MASLSHKLVSTIAWLQRSPKSKIVGIDPGTAASRPGDRPDARRRAARSGRAPRARCGRSGGVARSPPALAGAGASAGEIGERTRVFEAGRIHHTAWRSMSRTKPEACAIVCSRSRTKRAIGLHMNQRGSCLARAGLPSTTTERQRTAASYSMCPNQIR